MTAALPAELSIAELGRGLRAKEFTAEELCGHALAQIGEADGQIHSFIRVEAAAALRAARLADAELRAGRDRGAMHGIPYALKDIYDVAGLPTTCHSRSRLDAVAAVDSAVAGQFRAAGAVLLGKLALHEFAIGGPSFDLPFPPARNPWDLDHIPGGSSSGSAAAVAAGFVRLATGTCTGGSIRGPAAWCGVVGLKPTYGRVSRRGVFPLSWTLDHCGVLARSVEDAAIGLGVMAAFDPLDPASADCPVADYRVGLESGVAGLRVGVPRGFFENQPALTPDARQGVETALAGLREAGAIVEDVALPEYDLFRAANRVIMTAEMYAIHKPDLQCRAHQYSELTLRRLLPGVAIDAADYVGALRLRRALGDAVNDSLDRQDVLVTAMSLASAPAFGPHATAWPLQAATFNLTGHPAMSVPVGLGSDGLPLAVQIAGRAFDEATVLRVGRAVEIATGWDRRPLAQRHLARLV